MSGEAATARISRRRGADQAGAGARARRGRIRAGAGRRGAARARADARRRRARASRIPRSRTTTRRALLDALLDLRIDDPDSRYGDLVNVRERALEQRVGDAAGWLNAGRPRREAGTDRVPDRAARRGCSTSPRRSRGSPPRSPQQAANERDTLMPDYTYLQVAQPTTAGHWLLSFAYPALRDAAPRARRLRRHQPQPRRRRRRQRVALRDRPRAARRACSASAPRSSTRATRCGRPTASPRRHCTRRRPRPARAGSPRTSRSSAATSSGCCAIGDELCRASALMPQKRNPYALVVIRGGARTLLGRATGVLASQQTPSGRTDNLLYAYGEVAGAVELATRLLNLAAKTAETLTIDRGRAERALRDERRDGDRRGGVDDPAGWTTARRTSRWAAPWRPASVARPRPARSDRHAHGDRRRGACADGRDARRVPRGDRRRARPCGDGARRDRRSGTRAAQARSGLGSRSSVS